MSKSKVSDWPRYMAEVNGCRFKVVKLPGMAAPFGLIPCMRLDNATLVAIHPDRLSPCVPLDTPVIHIDGSIGVVVSEVTHLNEAWHVEIRWDTTGLITEVPTANLITLSQQQATMVRAVKLIRDTLAPAESLIINPDGSIELSPMDGPATVFPSLSAYILSLGA